MGDPNMPEIDTRVAPAEYGYQSRYRTPYYGYGGYFGSRAPYYYGHYGWGTESGHHPSWQDGKSAWRTPSTYLSDVPPPKMPEGEEGNVVSAKDFPYGPYGAYGAYGGYGYGGYGGYGYGGYGYGGYGYGYGLGHGGGHLHPYGYRGYAHAGALGATETTGKYDTYLKAEEGDVPKVSGPVPTAPEGASPAQRIRPGGYHNRYYPYSYGWSGYGYGHNWGSRAANAKPIATFEELQQQGF